MKIAARCALFALIIIAITASPVNVFSCGPFFPKAIFVFQHRPDIPPGAFLRGNLGIVQPGFSKDYLFIAYRYLSGHDLSSDEQKWMGAMYQPDSGRDTLSWGHDDWITSRQKVLGPNPNSYYWPSTLLDDTSRHLYSFYENILYDGYETAMKTLEDLINKFGAQNPYVVDWVRAQDMVFESVDSGRAPSPVDPAAPAIFQADRAYQIAAAHFYMRDYAVAESLFASIARENSSPWQKTSRFLIARSMIREATLLASDQDSLLYIAEDSLRAFLKDPEMKEFHPVSRRLLYFCIFRTDPQGLFMELDRRINSPKVDSAYPTEWRDYAALLRQFADSSLEGKSDFATWSTRYLGREDSASFAESYDRWQKTKSSAWLIAALSDASPKAHELQPLLDAASATSPEDPGYATITYWRIRLLTEEGRSEQAKKLIGTLLDCRGVRASMSSTNLILLERIKFVNDLDEFLRCCHQIPCGIYQEDEAGYSISSDSLPLFTSAALMLNEYVPLALLDSACHGTTLPRNLRAELLRATWTRAYLLGREDITLDLGKVLSDRDPELKTFMDQYDSTKSDDARRFTGAYILLKFPGLQPAIRIGKGRLDSLDNEDDYRDNWWYPESKAYELMEGPIYVRGYYSEEDEEPDSIQLPDFISTINKQEGKKEAEELNSLPVAATYLAGIVNGWAKSHPDDPRVPEALHRVVEVNRVGCADPGSQKGEKDAFNMLHKQYPNSEWTGRTQYWY